MTDLTKENFEEEVLKAEGYILVDFYGDGCVPCAALMPHIHGFEEVYGSTIKFCSLNTTKARRLAISQKVLGLPVIAIYKDGLMIDSRCRLPRYLTKPRQRRSEWDMAGSDGISRVSAVFRGKSLLTNKMRII